MKFKIRILALLLMAIAGTATSTAQDTPALGKKEKKSLVSEIASGYSDWQTVTLSGKLRMDILPLSPSVRIFMERDSVIRISLRAPLVGEVGRAEIDADSVLVVNKMKKTYVKESLQSVLSVYPGTLSDLQDVLLGRIVMPGKGTLNADSWKDVEVFEEEEQGFSLFPAEKLQIEGVQYGYLLTSDKQTKALAVIPKENVVVGISYDFPGEGENLSVSYQTEKRTIAADLNLDKIDWGGKGFDPLKINSRYRKMDFKQFLKSF